MILLLFILVAIIIALSGYEITEADPNNNDRVIGLRRRGHTIRHISTYTGLTVPEVCTILYNNGLK